MDELSDYNKERWEALVRANVEWSRAFLDLDEGKARKILDPHGLLGEPAGKRVLCLGGGGGQQSAAFGLLGAQVTAFDLAENQLERDRLVAAARDLYGRCAPSLAVQMRMDCALDLWLLTRERSYLADARARLEEVLAAAPTERRDEMLRNVGIYRSIAAEGGRDE